MGVGGGARVYTGRTAEWYLLQLEVLRDRHAVPPPLLRQFVHLLPEFVVRAHALRVSGEPDLARTNVYVLPPGKATEVLNRGGGRGYSFTGSHKTGAGERVPPPTTTKTTTPTTNASNTNA